MSPSGAVVESPTKAKQLAVQAIMQAAMKKVGAGTDDYESSTVSLSDVVVESPTKSKQLTVQAIREEALTRRAESPRPPSERDDPDDDDEDRAFKRRFRERLKRS